MLRSPLPFGCLTYEVCFNLSQKVQNASANKTFDWLNVVDACCSVISGGLGGSMTNFEVTSVHDGDLSI